MKNLPVAVQVYSVRDDASSNFKGTMQNIKDIGYDGVELAGLYGMAPAEVKQILDEIGLIAISAHVPFAELIADTADTLDQYVTIGCKYIAVPYLEEADRPGTSKFEDTLKEIARIGQACKDRGLTLLYHNHDFEFVKMPDGRYGLDYMYETIPSDLLQTEIDTCWVNVAGEDPAAYVEKYTGRSPVVHLKDFYKEGNPENMYKLIGLDTEEAEDKDESIFEFRPLGEGLQNIPSILEASLNAGAKWVVVEQDESVGRTPMEAITMSRNYLKTLGW